MVSGAAVANSFLGVPDLGLVSVSELAQHVAAVCDAVDIPVLVDCDTGFGNALNTRRTVQMMERAGASALMLEDQTYPKRCGHFDGKSVVPVDEMVGKLKAAVDARVDPRLMILARTDARAVEGFEAALDRARQYQEAGADWLFVEAPLTREELLAIPREVPGIHLCNLVIGGKTPLLAQAELAAAGYAAICYANAALQAAMRAMQRCAGPSEGHRFHRGNEVAPDDVRGAPEGARRRQLPDAGGALRMTLKPASPPAYVLREGLGRTRHRRPRRGQRPVADRPPVPARDERQRRVARAARPGASPRARTGVHGDRSRVSTPARARPQRIADGHRHRNDLERASRVARKRPPILRLRRSAARHRARDLAGARDRPARGHAGVRRQPHLHGGRRRHAGLGRRLDRGRACARHADAAAGQAEDDARQFRRPLAGRCLSPRT